MKNNWIFRCIKYETLDIIIESSREKELEKKNWEKKIETLDELNNFSREMILSIQRWNSRLFMQGRVCIIKLFYLFLIHLKFQSIQELNYLILFQGYSMMILFNLFNDKIIQYI